MDKASHAYYSGLLAVLNRATFQTEDSLEYVYDGQFQHIFLAFLILGKQADLNRSNVNLIGRIKMVRLPHDCQYPTGRSLPLNPNLDVADK